MTERVTCPAKLYEAFMGAGGVEKFRQHGPSFQFIIWPPIQLTKLDDEPAEATMTIYHHYRADLQWKCEGAMLTYWVEVDGIRITHPWRDRQDPSAYLPQRYH